MPLCRVWSWHWPSPDNGLTVQRTAPAAGYTGRFAPSPTGPLHAGSLVAALASWLDARAHAGRWLVRIEDVDTPRCVAGADRFILQQLAQCGLKPDAPPLWQSQRSAAYQQALEALQVQALAYPCGCSRKDMEAAALSRGDGRLRHGERIYPGTCRGGLQGRTARAWRLRAQGVVDWQDRRLGPQTQDVAEAVGDFVLLRADGLWAYQLAVVVDDAAQGVTQVVRGEDLCDNTARQILLQRALHLPTPGYLHTALVLDAHGEKLSKQNGAPALDTATPAAAVAALRAAAAALGLTDGASGDNRDALLARWLAQWTQRWRSATGTESPHDH